jgi:hypothetical protein
MPPPPPLARGPAAAAPSPTSPCLRRFWPLPLPGARLPLPRDAGPTAALSPEWAACCASAPPSFGGEAAAALAASRLRSVPGLGGAARHRCRQSSRMAGGRAASRFLQPGRHMARSVGGRGCGLWLRQAAAKALSRRAHPLVCLPGRCWTPPSLDHQSCAHLAFTRHASSQSVPHRKAMGPRRRGASTPASRSAHPAISAGGSSLRGEQHQGWRWASGGRLCHRRHKASCGARRSLRCALLTRSASLVLGAPPAAASAVPPPLLSCPACRLPTPPAPPRPTCLWCRGGGALARSASRGWSPPARWAAPAAQRLRAGRGGSV